jgi:hypothetical protein
VLIGQAEGAHNEKVDDNREVKMDSVDFQVQGRHVKNRSREIHRQPSVVLVVDKF